jgi:hypothetical protein
MMAHILMPNDSRLHVVRDEVGVFAITLENTLSLHDGDHPKGAMADSLIDLYDHLIEEERERTEAWTDFLKGNSPQQAVQLADELVDEAAMCMYVRKKVLELNKERICHPQCQG